MSYWKGRKRGPQSPEHKAKTVVNLTGVNGKPPWNKSLKLPQFSGENHPSWKGDKAGYFTVHSWLKRHFGKADKCENPFCKKISKKFHWAKIKGKTYTHNRENFQMLCNSCHALYDEFPGPPKGLHKGNTYRRLNLIGQKFGKLIVISLTGKNKWGNLKFLCKCDCGGQKIVPSASLRDGRTKSCGCMSSRNFMKGNKFRQGKAPWNKKVR